MSGEHRNLIGVRQSVNHQREFTVEAGWWVKQTYLGRRDVSQKLAGQGDMEMKRSVSGAIPRLREVPEGAENGRLPAAMCDSRPWPDSGSLSTQRTPRR